MNYNQLQEYPFLYDVVSFIMTSVNVDMRARRMRCAWTPEMAADVGAYQGIDAEAELTRILEENLWQGIVSNLQEYVTLSMTILPSGKLFETNGVMCSRATEYLFII